MKKMGFFRRWFYTLWWLFKSLYCKLSPFRRLLLIIALISIIPTPNLNILGVHVNANERVLGALLLLFILMLELKDKMTAADELKEGRKIQLALMPKESHQFSGWDIWLYSHPANDVGGDLVDILTITAKKSFLVLGDVAGKALPAALLMVKLQATIRALAAEFDSPAELVQKINQIFFRDSLPQRFASLIYLEFSPEQSTVKLINAGHMPPICVKRNQLIKIEKGGLALGLRRDSVYKQQILDLEAGDWLCLYSDGISEAQNNEGAFFGDQRLSELLYEITDLNSETAGHKILQAIDEFLGDEKPQDDISLILLKKL
jgi:sigma-B regulation protein RsbU (phosphoserine phosphatase)